MTGAALRHRISLSPFKKAVRTVLLPDNGGVETLFRCAAGRDAPRMEPVILFLRRNVHRIFQSAPPAEQARAVYLSWKYASHQGVKKYFYM